MTVRKAKNGRKKPGTARPIGLLRVDTDTTPVPVQPGEPAMFIIEVANADEVIREVTFGVLGMDATWVSFEPALLTLFPEERSITVVTVTLPEGFPAGLHDIAVEVTDTADAKSPVVTHLAAEVAADHHLLLRVDPTAIDTTTHGQFTATITNRGNSTLEVEPTMTEPEGLTTAEFSPSALRLLPGEEAVVRVDVRGKRPWFGASALRFLTIEAKGYPAADDEPHPTSGLAQLATGAPPTIGENTGDQTTLEQPAIDPATTDVSNADGAPTVAPAASGSEAVTAEGPRRDEPVVVDTAHVSVTHRARIPRKRLTLLGLLLAASTFALVFSISFGKVAAKTKASEDLLKKSLAGEAAGTSGAASPSGIVGTVVSTTGEPIDGSTVDLYNTEQGGLDSIRSTVTDETGTFRFPGLAEGTYRIKVTAAGYGVRWYPQSFGFDEGQDIPVVAGGAVEGLQMQLAGQPGAIAGVVLGDKVEGAKVTVRLPAGAVAGSTTPTEVSTVAVGGDGVFEMIDLPAPGTYEIAATAPGLTAQPRTISLQPGQRVDKVALLLQPGVGIVTGRVVDSAGRPISGAAVAVIAGTARRETITLSGDAATSGRFELREFAVPSTLSVTVSAPGYLTASETLILSEQAPSSDRSITLLAASGQLGGMVTGPDGAPLGGVTVTVSGGSFNRTTATLSQGDVGRWLVDDVPTPGDYTVTFSADRIVPLTQAVGLSRGNTGRLDVDVTVSSAVAGITGLVRELGSVSVDPPSCIPDDDILTDCPGRLGGVSIVLSATGVERRTSTAHFPTGMFQLQNLPPGPYTVTFDRVGSTPQTLFVELVASQQLRIPDIFLEPQARIGGRVTRNGLPVSNVGVKIYLAANYPQVAEATVFTDASGDYTVVGLVAPETYIVEFQYPAGGQIVASQEIFLRPGTAVDGSQVI